MHGLSEIISMNRKAATKVETNHNRHCSWTENNGFIVLHSAKLRNTVCLNPKQAAYFSLRVRVAGDNLARVDWLIESYFKGGAI
jgi:hypothetical protein